jgi:putative DNA primase/helicase
MADSTPARNEKTGPDDRLLHNHHLEDLRRSGLSDETIRNAEIFSINQDQARQLLHRDDIFGGGYAIPYAYPDSTPILQQDGQPYVNVKLDTPPRDKKGKPIKYIKPKREPNHVYVPRAALEVIKTATKPLIVTEGEKKSLKSTQHGFAAVALSGVWGFRTRLRGRDRSLPLPELDRIPMSGREILVVFDSDAVTNPRVQQAEAAFSLYAATRGAQVYCVKLPGAPNGMKIGLDDFLVQQGEAALGKLIDDGRAAHGPQQILTKPADRLSTADLADAFLVDHGWSTPDGLGLRFYRGEWLRFDGRIYAPLPDAELQSHLVTYLRTTPARQCTTLKLVKNILMHVQAVCVIPASTALPAIWTGTQWNPAPYCLVFTNGILDVAALLNASSNQVLTRHIPTFVSTARLSFDFDASARCPRWLRFLKQILPDAASRRLLKEIFGYCLTSDTSLQKFFLFEGIGANGKGVVMRIMTRLLGDANISNLPLEMFGAPHDLIVTLGKLVNLTSDMGDLDRVAEGMLKQFTGDDTMHFNPKYRQPFSAKPTAKLVIAANTRPPFRDRSEGVWRRLIILPFRTSILPEKQNPDLTDELTTELSGILNWAVAGGYDLRRRRRFLESAVGIEAKEEFRLESNPARRFLMEHCRAEVSGEELTTLLYQAYAGFCKEHGFKPLNETHFGRELHRVFPQVKKRRLGPQQDDSRPYIYDGIKFAGQLVSY